MIDRSAQSAIETILRDELTRGDLALSGVAPVLTHMLSGSGGSLVSEAIVARLRGMLGHLAHQLLTSKSTDYCPDEADRLTNFLASDGAVLSHCYAIAMEGHLTERLERKASLDPILSPLMQELIASDSAEVAELAMTTLAAQSRFVQTSKRMEMPLAELPAEVFQCLLQLWAQAPIVAGADSDKAAMKRSLADLRAGYDEGAARAGLLARLVSAMRGGSRAALSLEHAGLALFSTALSALTRQPRELAILSCHERQSARLALSLRAAGMIESEIEQQFAILHPEQQLPSGFDHMLPDRAQTLISQSDKHAVSQQNSGQAR
ncbi:MAG: hypothetical protein AAGL68_10945 [Pseudomonadota bacterium]